MKDVSKDPSRSFPEIFEDASQLEGLYRFLGNKRLTFQSLLLPHRLATLQRVIGARRVLAIHDTTECIFRGEKRRELGRVSGPGGGFLAHTALAVDAANGHEVLGVLGCAIRYQKDEVRPRGDWRKQWLDPDKLSLRWLDLARETRQFVANQADVIHVMDREGDSYELLSHLVTSGDRFIIRAAKDRLLADRGGVLTDALAGLAVVAKREVRLSKRTSNDTAGNAPREARTATLTITATRVELLKPRGLPKTGLAPKIAVNVVLVRELSPPEGLDPVEWRIYTTEPIDTEEQILQIVDHYRARWLIEEFFKSLKTGCAFEKRQLDSRHTVENSLALMIPMAWTLMVLRWRGRQEAESDAPLSPQQLAVLRAVSRAPLPDRIDAGAAMLAVARLGGHLKSNGPPGWQVLGRGLAKLLAYEIGWEAALREK